MSAEFWKHKRLDRLTPEEWESLCDGCGRCCVIKLEDDETGGTHYTDVACRLFDDHSCRCGQYDVRASLVKGCVVLTPRNLPEVAHWMPRSCAYRRLHEGRGLADWHPLVSGDPGSVHEAGISLRHRTVPEWEVADEELEDHVIDDGDDQ